MGKKQTIYMTLVATFFGLMISLQFKTANSSDIRDTRDIWQLQEALTKAEKKHIKMSRKLMEERDLLKKYKDKKAPVSLKAMKEELQSLEKAAGLTEVTDRGVVLTISPLVQSQKELFDFEEVTDVLLRRLINQLNQFGATEISVSGERIIYTSPIRLVNGELMVNDHIIEGVPFKIKVLATEPKELKKKLEVSLIADNFARNGLQIKARIKREVTLPPYEQTIHAERLKNTKRGS